MKCYTENTIAFPSMGGYFGLKNKPLCHHPDSQNDFVIQLECVKCIYSEELHKIDTCGGDIFNLNSGTMLFPNILFPVVHVDFECIGVSHISEKMVA